MKQLVIDLFSGTRSLEKPCLKLGFEYLAIDNNPELKPDICADLMTWKGYGELRRPFIVWASPPCTHFSVAAIGRNWNRDLTPKTEAAAQAIELVKRTLWLIVELMPRFWFVENPRGMLRRFDMMRTRPCMNTVTYCQYGDTRMKPTDIWHNCYTWIPRPACKNGDPCHVRAPRGSKTGTQGLLNAKERGRVPSELLTEILTACTEAAA
jgi:hypothetical protein